MKLCHFIGCTWRCGSPEKAAEASEDIRQSERSIFRRFGKACKDNHLPTVQEICLQKRKTQIGGIHFQEVKAKILFYNKSTICLLLHLEAKVLNRRHLLQVLSS